MPEFWVTSYPATSADPAVAGLCCIVGFVAGTKAEEMSRMSQTTVVTRSLAQLDHIFGKQCHTCWTCISNLFCMHFRPCPPDTICAKHDHYVWAAALSPGAMHSMSLSRIRLLEVSKWIFFKEVSLVWQERGRGDILLQRCLCARMWWTGHGCPSLAAPTPTLPWEPGLETGTIPKSL